MKQAIIDDIDKIINSIYENGKSKTSFNEDGIELLSDFSIEGFNLKAVTRSIMSILGKKNKHIGGYITLNDSTQTVAIQVTDQITQPISVNRGESVQKLIRKATLEIMKVKSPGALISYYMTKNDTTMVKTVYLYLNKHRELTKADRFYDISVSVCLYERRLYEAFAWTDSLQAKFPNDKATFYNKAKIYGTLAYTAKADSATIRKNKRLYVDNLKKASDPDRVEEAETNIDYLIDNSLAAYFYSESDYKPFIEVLEKISTKNTLTAAQNNGLAYAYISQKEYQKAEEALRKALFLASDTGDYWDSLAELHSLQAKDSLAVANLSTALACPKKSAAVSVQAYQKDARWQRLRKREDFQALMKQGSTPVASPGR